ncbi:MAG: Glycogen synthase [Firmicutes bacterium ADurb.Bin080]|jgi:starch synthase|nr:glycogen synthase GlgA [Clostridiales bacterium]OQC16817.1 MAG: Glycogen synthase [Firmicutes bacterium ADurb.Bin080]
MKVLYATSEAGPFIRTGGLGDVSAALPVALAEEKIEVSVVLPYYEDIPNSFKSHMRFLGATTVPLGWRRQYAGLFQYVQKGVSFFFVDNEYYFKRKGLYGHFDDGERFAFFSKAVLELIPLMKFTPDIIHCNDWQTSLIPVMLDSFYRNETVYSKIKTVQAIHNIEFQGRMDKYVIDNVFGIPEKNSPLVEYRGDANMLKGGIEASNKVVTVSPSYAAEILDPYFSYGLEFILRERQYKIIGILNGIDTELYNPETDRALFTNFSCKDPANKVKNKIALQKMIGLPENADKPMIGMVGRLTGQKGIDLVLRVIHEILSLDVQLVILGTGDWKYENAIKEMEKQYPTKLNAAISFSADMASKIYAASDLFLMPSKFEPCGLSQMIAMRYGSIPIVRETGGLRDSVEPYNPTTGLGVGFTFKTFDACDMLDAVNRAVSLYYNDKKGFETIKRNAMGKDFSWRKSAKQYINMYETL